MCGVKHTLICGRHFDDAAVHSADCEECVDAKRGRGGTEQEATGQWAPTQWCGGGQHAEAESGHRKQRRPGGHVLESHRLIHW